MLLVIGMLIEAVPYEAASGASADPKKASGGFDLYTSNPLQPLHQRHAPEILASTAEVTKGLERRAQSVLASRKPRELVAAEAV